jgi:hypothetical protein
MEDVSVQIRTESDFTEWKDLPKKMNDRRRDGGSDSKARRQSFGYERLAVPICWLVSPLFT